MYNLSYLWHFHYWHTWLRVGKSNVFALVVSVASKRNNINSAQRMSYNRATFVWLWNENARTTQQTNGNRAIWLVYRTDTNARGFWLVERTPENFLEIILRFEVIQQHDWPIEQSFLHIRVFFVGKTKRPYSNLFIYWLIKQITNTYRSETIFQGHKKI